MAIQAVELPSLPFADHTFDITLSAHFLFTDASRLSYQFHYPTGPAATLIRILDAHPSLI